ncbi:MAG: hypothetical protein WBR15_04355 [Gammaproteobacteria bacterium]
MHLGDVRKQRILLLAAVCVLLATTVIAYYPGLHGPFLFDDITNIRDNRALLFGSFSLHALLRAAFSARSGILYRPLSMLSFAFNIHFFGNQSFPFKLINLIIHLFTALLILWLTQRLLINCRNRYRFEWPDSRISWVSVLVAGVWMLHPLNLTPVLFIVQRMTSLAALFTLAGILAYVHGRERMLVGKMGWPLVWLLTPLFGLLGVLCKEDAALLPLYLLVIEWLIFGFRGARQSIAKNLLAFYLFGLVLPGILGLAYLIHTSFWAGYAYRDFTLPERLFTELRVVILYVQWTFIPDIRNFALFHDDIAVSKNLLTPLTTLWSLLVIISLMAIAWWQRKRRPILSLGILFFFAGQVMESTIIPLELAYEHRNYLPDYGLLLAAISLLLLPATDHAGTARISLRWAIVIMALPVLFLTTNLRASEWNNYLDFTYYEAQHHPQSPRAVYSLGQMYAMLALGGDSGAADKAMHTLTQATSLTKNIMPDVAMMMMSTKLKLPINPDWLSHAQMILKTHPVGPEDTGSLNNLTNCLPTDCKPLISADHALLQAAFRSDNLQAINRSRADLWTIYANYLTFTDAPLSSIITAMQHAVQAEPNIPRYRISLTKGLIMSGDFDMANEEISELSRQNTFGSVDQDIQSLRASLEATRAAADKSKHKSH